MLLIRNKAALSTPVATTSDGITVPFDTVVYNTNGNAELKDNEILIKNPGFYSHEITVGLKNTTSSAVTVNLQAYADGKAVDGAIETVTVGATSSAVAVLPWITHVISASSGVAKISWMVSGGVLDIVNASVRLFKQS